MPSLLWKLFVPWRMPFLVHVPVAAVIPFLIVGLIPALLSLPVAAEEIVNFPTGHPPNASFGFPIRPLTRSSGYIFSGTVKAVDVRGPERVREGSDDLVPTVQITFHVDEAIRGVSRGQTLVIREWAGLWQSGERYRPGERVLLFLYPPSKLGLTSPVGGQLGRFPEDPGGRVILNPPKNYPRKNNPPTFGRGDPGFGKILVDPRDFARALGLAPER